MRQIRKVNRHEPKEKAEASPFHAYLKKKNQELGKIVAEYMYVVYNDAKRGTISANSFPPRVVASKMGRNADSEREFRFHSPSLDMQYSNPGGYKNFLSTMVKTDLPNLKEKLVLALAVSLRVDGSVDRFLLDNKHVMAKAVLPDGSDELLFVGFFPANGAWCTR